MKKLLSLFLVIAFASCSNKVIVQKAVKGELLTNRLFYALPANSLDFEVKIKEEVFTPGPYFLDNAKACLDYITIGADSLGLDKKVLAEMIAASGNWTNYELLADEIKWSEGAIPDTSKIYIFKNESKFYKDNALALSFNSDWMISQGTISSENKSFEIFTTFISTGVSVAASVFKSGVKPPKGKSLPEICDKRFARLVKLKKTYEDFQMNPLKDVTAEALELAKNVRLKLIEKEIEALFYKKKETVRVMRFSLYLSEKFKDVSELKLFKVRNSDGVLLINAAIFDDLLWPKKSSYIIGQSFSAADADAYKLTTINDSKNVLDALGTASFPKPVARLNYGIVYNVPRNQWFYLTDMDKKLVKESRFPIAQWGTENALDPRLNKAEFTIDSLTGRLVKASMESKAWITSDKIKTGGALLPQLDSVIRKPKPTAVKQLEDEVKELELRVKKKEAEAKLN
ncbi:hypothetical protein [Mucilaginibacter phyllosphaerae]